MKSGNFVLFALTLLTFSVYGHCPCGWQEPLCDRCDDLHFNMNNNCYSCDYCIGNCVSGNCGICEDSYTLIGDIQEEYIQYICEYLELDADINQNQTQELGLYVWNGDNQKPWWNLIAGIPPTNTDFINYMSLTNYTRTIIYNGALQWDSYASGNISYKSGYSDLLCSLENTTNGILFYINDNVNDFTGYQAVTEFATAVNNFNLESVCKISFVHMDQEPNNPSKYPLLIDSLRLLRETLDSSVLLELSIKPLWLHNSTLMNEILEYADDIVIMAYSNTLSGIVDILSNVTFNKKYYIAIEMTKPGTKGLPASDTMYGNNPYVIISQIAEIFGDSVKGYILHDYNAVKF